MKLALAQILVEGGEYERNFARAEKFIIEAARQGADLILLPETIDFAWTHPRSLNESVAIPGAFSERFCALAREHRVYICVGLTEKAERGNYNSAVLIDRNGTLLGVHRKINLLGVEFPFYNVGQELKVIDTEFGKIGLSVCADNYYDSLHLGHALARMGAQLILCPSSWTVDYSINEANDPYRDKWLKPFSILASYYNIVVAGTTSVGYIVGGPYEGKKMIGCSLLVGKKGVIAQGQFNEFAGELVIADIELEKPFAKGTEIGLMLQSRGYKFDEML